MKYNTFGIVSLAIGVWLGTEYINVYDNADNVSYQVFEVADKNRDGRLSDDEKSKLCKEAGIKFVRGTDPQISMKQAMNYLRANGVTPDVYTPVSSLISSF